MIDLHLPFPPSINVLWSYGKGRVHLSSIYVEWKKAADVLAMRDRKPETILGAWEAKVFLSTKDRRRRDIDNYATKAIFDWLQSREYVANDAHCERYSVEWVRPKYAPWGARIALKPYEGELAQ